MTIMTISTRIQPREFAAMNTTIMATKHSSDTKKDEPYGVSLVLEKPKIKPKKPPLYKVLMLNDDYTPMEFVVNLLMRFFTMNRQQAERVMLHVHTRGIGLCGIFPREVAESKVRLVLESAEKNQHPLQCVFEKE